MVRTLVLYVYARLAFGVRSDDGVGLVQVHGWRGCSIT